MNSSKIILVLFISLSSLAVGAPRVAHADGSNPTSTLQIGDWWKYNVATPISSLTLTGSETQTIVSQSNTTLTEWALRNTASGTLAGGGVTGTWVESGWAHMRKTDLAEIDSRFSLNMTLVGNAGTAVLYFWLTSTNSPPILQYQFPLAVGNSWTMMGGNETVTTVYYYSFDPTVRSVTNKTSTNAVYNVLASPLTSVEAGTFDSYKIRKTAPDGSYTDDYYSPETENIVKETGFAANGTQESSMTLTDYGAWPYKTSIGLSAGGTAQNAIIETDVPATDIHLNATSIIFTVSGTDTVTGKASIWIPNLANNTRIRVYVDNSIGSFTTSSNGTFYQIQFNFPLSTHTITLAYLATVSHVATPSLLDRYLLPLVIGIAAIAAVIIVTAVLLVRRRGRKPEPTPFWQPPSAPPAAPPTPVETPPPAPLSSN